MKSPSIKALTEAFRDLSKTDAHLIKRIAYKVARQRLTSRKDLHPTLNSRV